MAVVSLSLPMAARATLGPLPFHAALGCIEWIKVSFTTYIGLNNFSSALQLSHICSIRCGTSDTCLFSEIWVTV